MAAALCTLCQSDSCIKIRKQRHYNYSKKTIVVKGDFAIMGKNPTQGGGPIIFLWIVTQKAGVFMERRYGNFSELYNGEKACPALFYDAVRQNRILSAKT